MNAVQYIKNVGKSFGYVAVDTLKEYNPAITSTISQAKDLSTDLYQFVKDIKSSASDRMSKSESSLLQLGKDTVSDLWKNTKSDLMTGNFYNKARKDEAENAMMESMMGFSMDDFNFDDDFGDFDFDDDMGSKSADPDNNGISDEAEVQVRTTEAMIRSMDSVGYAMSGSINRTSVKTAEYIVAAQERSSRALYDLSNRGFKQINVGLGAINANMSTIATLAQPLTTHMQNSATFYTNTSEYQKKTLELLGKIVENTSPVQTNNDRSRTKGTISDLMSGGILDVRAYAEYVGGNVKDYFSLITDMIGMMGGAKAGSKVLTASPISYAMKTALQGVMPKVLKESMKDFNEMLEGVFQTALGSMESKNWGIFEILKDIFVPKSDYKSKLNTSKYHKGKVDWDGKSRKALLEVIPRYLAEISSALTGQPMRIYDFDAGRFKTVSAIKKEWTDMYQNAANSAGSDLRSSANDILGSLVSKNKISEGKRTKMMSEIESYLLIALQSGDSEFLDIMKDNFNHIKYGLSDDSVKLIRSIFKYTDSHKNRRFRSRTMGSIYEQRNSIGRRISDIEADGSSVFNVLFDENPENRSSLLLGTDKDGKDIFFYLRGIYENTMGNGRGRGGSRRSRNNKPSGGGGSAAASNIGSFSDIDDGTLDTLIEESFTGDKPYFPNRELEEYYYNKKANPNYPINNDLEEELEKWIKMNNAGKDIKSRASKNPVINKVLKTIGLAGDMLDKATVGISNMIDSASKTITEFVYGENGTIGLFETIKGLFTDFRGTLKAMFGRGKDYFFGENGKLRPFMNSVGDNLKSAKEWLKNRFTGTAANGRRVTRSGMVSVSEGEMIIPAELNPYYHGTVNKRTQRRNELRNAAKFYGFFDEGGTVGQDGVGTTAEESVERTQEASVSFIKKILEKIFPNDTKGESKKVQDVITKALDTLKGKGGAMGAGALVGTGVSLFTGGMISPILGAGLGAAAGLIIKSKEIQTALFGDEEKDGMTGHHISEFVKKHLPSVATGSALGLAGGLFLGSPVMGAILGGAAGYVNSSIQAKEFLFGSNELDSGIFSKEFQKRFKQNLPKMALGATAGLAFGPFGLAGNIILGAAAGYATDVEKSKKFLFGDPDNPDDKGGLFGHVKDDFFKPLLTIFDNLAESLRHTIRDVFHGVAKSISNGLANMLKKSRIAGAVGNRLGQLGSKLYEGTWGVIGGTMRGIANRGTKKALRKGYLIRDRKSKSGFANAESRIEMRKQFGEDDGMVAGFDSILSRMETEAEYDEMLQGLQSMYNGTTGFNRQRSNYEKDAARNLEKAGVDKATAKAINKAMHNREYDTAMRLAEALPDTPAKKKVIGNIKAQRNYNSKIEGVDKARADLAKKLGVRPEELNDSTLANFMDLTRNEAKSRSLKTNEQVRQRQVEDAALKVPTLLEKILTAIVNPNSHGELSSWLNIGNTSVDTPREGDNKELNGEAYEYRNGIWVNKEEHEIKSKFMRTITEHFPIVGSALEKIGGAFTNLKHKLFGDPENDEDNGLLGGVFKKFFGEDSLIGHFISAVTGSTVGKGLKNMLSKITLKGIVSNVVGPALLLGGFSGEFDALGAKLGWGRQDNNTTTAITKSGETVTYDPTTGNYVTTNGRIVSPSEIDTSSVKNRKTDRRSVSQGLMYNLGRGVMTNTKNITSEVLGRTNIGKGIKNTFGKITNAVKGVRAADVDDGFAQSTAITSLYDEIAEAFAKIGRKLSKVPIVNKIDWDTIGSKFSVTIGNKLASESAESIAKLAANAVIWVKIAFCIIDYTTGYEDARSTMGIVDEPTLGQKVLSGCLRLVKNLIPIVGTFIPDNLIIDIFCDFVAPVLGISVEELKAQRSKAQETVDAWNASHPNQKVNSVTEYNKSVLKDYTWTERIGNAGRGIWSGTKAKFNSMKSGIKEKGLGGYLSSTISDMGTNFVESYKSEGGGLAGIFSGIGTTFGNMLPGILGEIAKANLDIKAKATKGDIKGLWSITLSDFSGGQTTEDGITTAVPSLFSKIIGQIPLFLNKLVCTPFALVTKLVNPVVDFAKNTLEKIKSGVSFVVDQGKIGYDLVHDTNSTLDQLFNVPEIDAGPMSGLVKAGLITSRLVGVGVAIIGRIGSNIGKKFGEFVDKAKGGWQKIKDNSELVKSAAMTGDVNAVWDVNIDTDPENPVGGIYKAALVANKLWYTVPSIFVGVGNNISDWFKKKTDVIKEDNTSLSDKLSELKETVNSGDLKDIWNAEYKASKENPIGFVYTIGFFIGKLFYSVASIFNTIMKPVKEVYEGVKEYAGNAVTGITKWAGEKVDSVKSGVKQAGHNIKTGATNAWNTASHLADAAWDKVTDFVGGNSGFVSQLDPRYSNMSIGNSTVGALGCGPASAVMALNQYSGNMSNAVNVAKGYQSAGGIDAAFFADYYARHGANASYYDGTTGAGKSNIVNSISSGSPVVLMGRDFRNRSKANSPFGPNNHYVVASGFDGAGNLIINDPESRGTRKYSSKILNNVSLGIGINGGRSGLLRRFGLAGGSSYSHDLRMDNVTKAIWKFFRDNGFSEEATAGIMGNMQAESGIDPTRSQVGGPAKGIVQWEGGRFTNMVNYAQSKGRDWTDLMSQLEFVLMEMKDSRVTFWKSNAKYCNNIEEFKKLKNVQQATHDFEEAFERAGVKALEKRYQYASYYYKAFSGKTPAAYDPSITAGVPYGTTQIPSSGSSSTGSVVGNAVKGLGILATINSAFGKIGDFFNGSSDSSASSNVVPSVSEDYSSYPSLPATAGNGNAQSLIDVAASQLNVVEGEGNRTKYGQFTGTDGQAWCAAFVSWCMNEAFGGNTNKLNAALRGGKSASVSVLRDQFNKANAMSSTPQPGDIVLYKKHTGIVESVNGTKLTTIEGNTSGSSGSQDNGGMVARKSWDYTDKGNWRTQQLTGFGRPDWEGASAAGSGLVPISSRRNQFKIVTHNQTGGSHVGSRRSAGASGISTDVAILLKSIITLIETLVKNTDRIDNIHEVLVSIAKSKGINDAATLAAIDKVSKSNDNSSIESSLSGLKAIVDNILAS